LNSEASQDEAPEIRDNWKSNDSNHLSSPKKKRVKKRDLNDKEEASKNWKKLKRGRPCVDLGFAVDDQYKLNAEASQVIMRAMRLMYRHSEFEEMCDSFDPQQFSKRYWWFNPVQELQKIRD
jgi:hypothetical protein